MEEPKISVASAAAKENLLRIAGLWERLEAVAQSLVGSKIDFVNTGREIGLSLQMLCQHEQIRMSFFENIKAELPKALTFSVAHKCIQLSNAFPEPITTIEKANHAEQLLLQAIGLQAIPERTGTQSAHDSTPDTFVWNTLAAAKDKLIKRLEDATSWDEEMRASVREQIRKHRLWLNEIEMKL